MNGKLPIVAMLTIGITLLSAGVSCAVAFPFWATGFGAIPLFVMIAIGGRLTALSAHALLNWEHT
ncbi:hypothetical protein ACFXPR_35680 [Nocardia tengchongensis]|uniref:hypothetical protein n=1 Tax=Nocardia tengchongensis TaxID=2055889 RepID=UPI0036789E20